jgi:ribonuclease Z
MDKLKTATFGTVSKLLSVPVEHCKESYGVVIDLSSFQRIVYSGDCRPSLALVEAGRYCDLLIHEATFNDDCSYHAIQKRHCTISEAISISQQICVKGMTVLTHFSQRYVHNTILLENDLLEKNTTPITVAYDYLHFSFPSQIPLVVQGSKFISNALCILQNSGGRLKFKDVDCHETT